MKGEYIGNCIKCGERIHEGWRHCCCQDEEGKYEFCECDADNEIPSWCPEKENITKEEN